MELEESMNVTLACEDVQSHALKCYFLGVQSIFSIDEMGLRFVPTVVQTSTVMYYYECVTLVSEDE